MTNIGVLASGRGSNFQAIIDAVESGYINGSIKLLISDIPDAYALERAKNHNIEGLYINPKGLPSKDAFYERIASELKARGVELVVLAGFMRVVRRPLLEAFPMAVINIHPALLPAFPGLHGQAQAADYGTKVAGCTVHFVDEGVDTGPVIVQAVVPAYADDTEESLGARILKQEHKIFPYAIKLFAQGRLEVMGRKVHIKGAAKDNSVCLINPPLE